MINERLIKLQHFFEVDLKIKKEMLSIAPASDNQYIDVEKYADAINDSLVYIFSELKCITSDFLGIDSSFMENIATLESTIKNNFYSCGYDINKLRLFYKNYISNMDPDFINTVKKECYGYSLSFYSAVEKAKTINEILHFLHSFIVNNNHFLQSIPMINKKGNDDEHQIVLRGVKVPIFEQLLVDFPDDLEVGYTDIVAVSERKLLMMVRDRGHALTIEITLQMNTARMEYFIPKICNIDMVNDLPGINKINQDSIAATGIIEIPINELSNTIFNFISKVPTDKDNPMINWNTL